jgi:hypothetical protein
MPSRRRLVLPFVLLGLLTTARLCRAQEVGLTGKVMDSTDAVLPSVTVTALLVEGGNTYVGVNDASGEYRLNAMRLASTQSRLN